MSSDGIFNTIRVPITHISQNHIDNLNNEIIKFCNTNKKYTWFLMTRNSKKIYSPRIDNYLNENRPSTITYNIQSRTGEKLLHLNIEHGILLNLKNGDYCLYGLYNSIIDSLDLVKVPTLLVAIRRYWAVSLFVSVLVIPTLVFLLMGAGWWVIVWILFMPLATFVAVVSLAEDNGPLSGIELKDTILPTKIRYGSYHSKVGHPILAALSSTKSIISILASVATILTFAFYVANR